MLLPCCYTSQRRMGVQQAPWCKKQWPFYSLQNQMHHCLLLYHFLLLQPTVTPTTPQTGLGKVLRQMAQTARPEASLVDKAGKTCKATAIIQGRDVFNLVCTWRTPTARAVHDAEVIVGVHTRRTSGLCHCWQRVVGGSLPVATTPRALQRANWRGD